MKRAIATVPGEPTQYIDLTPEEIAQVESQWSEPPDPPPMEQVVKAAFSALPLPLQIKFKDEIRDAAFFFERNNLPMVGVVMTVAESKLNLPDDQPVKNIIDTAKAALGV